MYNVFDLFCEVGALYHWFAQLHLQTHLKAQLLSFFLFFFDWSVLAGDDPEASVTAAFRAEPATKHALIPGPVSRPGVLSAHDGSDKPDGFISNKHHHGILITTLMESWLILSANAADRH